MFPTAARQSPTCGALTGEQPASLRPGRWTRGQLARRGAAHVTDGWPPRSADQMDEFDLEEETFTPFLRAVQAPVPPPLASGAPPPHPPRHGSLLAVAHPYGRAVAAYGNLLFAVLLRDSGGDAPPVRVTLPAVAAAVACSPGLPGAVVVLLDGMPAAQAVRAYDLRPLMEGAALAEVGRVQLHPDDDGDAGILCMQVAQQRSSSDGDPICIALAFDNGNAGIYGRLAVRESPSASTRR
jgi:hypothetical protein